MPPANVGDPDPRELIGVPNRSTRASVLGAAGHWNVGRAAARLRAAVGDLGLAPDTARLARWGGCHANAPSQLES